VANLTRIKQDKKLMVNKQILNYLNPDYVYIPYSKEYKLHVRSNDLINKEDILLMTKDNKYIYSPISGRVLGAATMQSGLEKIKTVVIENDFKEKTKKISGSKKYLNEYTKAEVLKLISDFNAYRGKFKGNIMVINGIDYEPYVSTNSYIISQYTNEILETIDALYSIFNIEKCNFAIKNNDSDNVFELVNHIGTYPNISLRLMPDLYPLGLKEVLIKELNLETKKHDVIYLTIQDVYAIYNVLKKKRPITEKLITVSGDKLSKQKVVNVKIGSTIKDIIGNNFKIVDDNYKIIINGLLGGYEIDNLNFIITPDIESIFINSIENSKERACINCGMCHTRCPYECDPKNNRFMRKCISCGVCSYVCSAKINFNERQGKK